MQPIVGKRMTRQDLRDREPREGVRSIFEQMNESAKKHNIPYIYSPQQIEDELDIIFGETDIDLTTTFPFQELEEQQK